ncbi:MAG TPA: hypothetical protein VF510_03175 [Ktedonobacterales bacterium]
MKTVAAILQILVRIIGPILIILGVLFWTGNAEALIPVHMLLGITLVLLLWTLAVLGAIAKVSPGVVALALVWGVIVPILGVTQFRLLPGSMHWIIQVLHLLLGLVAIGLADTLARQIKSRPPRRDAARQANALEGVGP